MAAFAWLSRDVRDHLPAQGSTQYSDGGLMDGQMDRQMDALWQRTCHGQKAPAVPTRSAARHVQDRAPETRVTPIAVECESITRACWFSTCKSHSVKVAVST